MKIIRAKSFKKLRFRRLITIFIGQLCLNLSENHYQVGYFGKIFGS